MTTMRSLKKKMMMLIKLKMIYYLMMRRWMKKGVLEKNYRMFQALIPLLKNNPWHKSK